MIAGAIVANKKKTEVSAEEAEEEMRLYCSLLSALCSLLSALCSLLSALCSLRSSLPSSQLSVFF
jgi:hypothetical protein